MLQNYDVIVVGAGHAGCEAAAAAANLGALTLLITMDMERIAQMSCNPAMGGIAKGQIIREIDALGGYSAIITDKSTIQFRMLNKSKGPAMWSPRAQCDRFKFSENWRLQLESLSNLHLWQGTVQNLMVKDNQVEGVVTDLGVEFFSKSVVLTNGTFLNGLIHIGRVQQIGGRIAERASFKLTEQLIELGFEAGRMKTGTPVRIDGRSINFSILQEQKGDESFHTFSYLNDTKSKLTQKSCFVTYTNEKVHEILKRGFEDSPLFNGTIQSIGPRYCPSIETKLVTFSDKNEHHLFLEPEGQDTVEFYLNGFSSSLPWNIQYEAINNIEGLENARIFRPGYAIEYDFFPPTQLYHSLETKKIKNLFFAGQINGTTGYEEAAAQGLIAGINAYLSINNKESFVLSRDEAYIGVLIDDLVTKGVDEPYRMFTSRAEYRVLLRQDNADQRLTEKSFKIGLADKNRYELYKNKYININNLIIFISNLSIKPEKINPFLEERVTSPLKQKVKLSNIVLRPQISLFEIVNHVDKLKSYIKENSISEEIIESAEISLKYQGYIERERILADKLKRLEDLNIDGKFDFLKIHTLSTEARQKLNQIQPKTIGQASRISGVNPSDINILLVLLGR
ncbi:MAG: tRNA uridine-5-carboxymethylaminomethyl(34) synthesis enzyme MnmG [Bacteroidota bacterium]|nr:tRNA uridine-5-carboxymethylaminomethyl(34) synthesis enzyme MnmG [Bacteroidota bacterium]